jgi:hypothetical protein
MDPSVYDLKFWIGQEVFASIPTWSRELMLVSICAVEAAGVWIESEGLTIGFCRSKAERDELDDIGKVSAFVPYTQIGYIMFMNLKEAQCAGKTARNLSQAEAAFQTADRRHYDRLLWASHSRAALPALAESRAALAAARSDLERQRKVASFADEVGERARVEEKERTL